MQENWKKRGNAVTVSDAVSSLSGKNSKELLFPKITPPEKIKNMCQAVGDVAGGIYYKEKFTIFGDYDADGVCSTAILFLALQEKGVKATVRLPKRMSEGYGLNASVIDEIESGVLITVDNGITAHEAIQKARDKGLYVIVLDHHLPVGEVPNANVIVDPHVDSDPDDFVDFCGAGLSYKFAERLLGKQHKLLPKLMAIAAIGTVADVMPLLGDNRVIVRDGLKYINERQVTGGLQSLLNACEFTSVNEQDIGYRIAPIINASGRLVDNGARLPCACLASSKELPKTAEQLIEINEKRKKVVADASEEVIQDIRNRKESVVGRIFNDITPKDTPDSWPQSQALVVVKGNIHKGVVGIIAGRLQDKYGAPTIVLSADCATEQITDETILEGSARSVDGFPIKEIFDRVQGSFILHQLQSNEINAEYGKAEPKPVENLFESYGGHDGAAGLRIKAKNVPQLRRLLSDQLNPQRVSSQSKLEYDLEIKLDDLPSTITEQSLYAPYGTKNPLPTYLIRGITLDDGRYGRVKYMGQNKEHVRFTHGDITIVGFNLSEKYNQLESPETIDVICRIGIKDNKYGIVKQIEIIDFEPTF